MTLDTVVRCRFLGHAQIEIGHTLVTPEAERLFALLMVLACEAGRSRTRDDLAELLWGDMPDERGKHNLRQTIYKARQIGVPFEGAGDDLRLPKASVWCDWEQPEIPIHGEWLESFTGAFSDPLASWILGQRAIVNASIRPRLLASMQVARSRGNMRVAHGFAMQLLRIDPFNEEATFVAAEYIALQGAKHDALQMLDAYMQEVKRGRDADDALLPARILRTRIAERLPVATYAAGAEHSLPLVGRDDELHQLTRAVLDVRAGRGGVTALWGPDGIGKSRLLAEIQKVAALQGVAVARDARSGTMVPGGLPSLLAKLMLLPGSLGTNPEALARIRAILGENGVPGPAALLSEPDSTDALADLLLAVSEETPLLVVLDHTDEWDAAAIALLLRALACCEFRNVGAMITSRQRPTHLGLQEADVVVRSVKLGRLHPDSMVLLLEHRAAELQLEDPRGAALAPAFAAEGNPAYGLELLGKASNPADADAVPYRVQTSIARRIRRLSIHGKIVLTTILALGDQVDHELIITCTGLSDSHAGTAISELLDQHLITTSEASYSISPLVESVDQVLSTDKPSGNELRKCAEVLRSRFRATSDASAFFRYCGLLARCGHESLAVEWATEDVEQLVASAPAPVILDGIGKLEAMVGLNGPFIAFSALRDEISIRARYEPLPSSSATRNRPMGAVLTTTPSEEIKFLGFSSRLDEYESALQKATDCTLSTSDRVRAGCHAIVLADNLHRRDLAEAARLSIEAAALGGSARDLDLARARLISASILGTPKEIIATANEAAATARAASDVGDACRLLRNAAQALLIVGEVSRARETANQALQLAITKSYAAQIVNTQSLLFVAAVLDLDKPAAHACVQAMSETINREQLTQVSLLFEAAAGEALLNILKGDLVAASRNVRALERWMEQSESPTAARQVRGLRLATQKSPKSRAELAEISEMAASLGSHRPDDYEDRVAYLCRVASAGTLVEAQVEAHINEYKSRKERLGYVPTKLL